MGLGGFSWSVGANTHRGVLPLQPSQSAAPAGRRGGAAPDLTPARRRLRLRLRHFNLSSGPVPPPHLISPLHETTNHGRRGGLATIHLESNPPQRGKARQSKARARAPLGLQVRFWACSRPHHDCRPLIETPADTPRCCLPLPLHSRRARREPPARGQGRRQTQQQGASTSRA